MRGSAQPSSCADSSGERLEIADERVGESARIDSGRDHVSDELIAAPGWQPASRGADARRR
jgi:hypothetical protein